MLQASDLSEEACLPFALEQSRTNALDHAVELKRDHHFKPTPERAYSSAPLRLRSVGSLLRSGNPAVHRGGFGGLSC